MEGIILNKTKSLTGTLSPIRKEGVSIRPLNVTENGTYSQEGVAYSPVEVDVAGLVPTGTLDIFQNGTYDVTEKEFAHVDVPNTYTASDEGKVVSGGELVGQTSRTVTENGTIDTTLNNEVVVNVSGGGENEDGIIDGSITQLVNTTATKVRREFASIVKHWDYRNLPNGYTQVEYIQGDGAGTYLDTGVAMDTSAVGKSAQFDVLFPERGVQPCVVGARLDNTNAMMFLYTYYGTPYWQYTNKSGSGANFAQNRVYSVSTELRNGWQTMAVDGASQTSGTNAGTVTSNLTFYAFARNNGGTAEWFAKVRLYSLVIRNGNSSSAKLCDLVPCIEDATGKYGMYDLVQNVFRGNLGSGDFTGGDPIPNLTYGYTSCDFAAVTEIGEYAFYNSDLSTLTLRANQVATLGAHALEETPIARGTGRINVPSSLVNAYKTAAGWSTYANRIFAIT